MYRRCKVLYARYYGYIRGRSVAFLPETDIWKGGQECYFAANDFWIIVCDNAVPIYGADCEGVRVNTYIIIQSGLTSFTVNHRLLFYRDATSCGEPPMY